MGYWVWRQTEGKGLSLATDLVADVMPVDGSMILISTYINCVGIIVIR